MESTAVPVRSAKRRRRHTSASDHRDGSSGGDLISGLGDDVLVHVLSFLPTAADVVRACAVSRLWRHLGARVPSLSFSSLYEKPKEKASRFIAFVNHILAARTAVQSDRPRIEKLDISLYLCADKQHEVLRRASRGAAQSKATRTEQLDAAQVDAWIRYGMQKVTKSFALILSPGRFIVDDNDDDDSMVLGELPSSARLETMVLSLNNATLRLPATVAFDSLTYLSLQEIRLAAGSGHLLGRLLSSACCPYLQKLHLTRIAGLTELQLDAGELSELSLEGRLACRTELPLLELNTPKLGVLHVEDCTLEALTIVAAPRLEEIAFSPMRFLNDIEQLAVGELPRVWSLKGLKLRSHGHPLYDAGDNDCTIRLLQQCRTSVECVGFSLRFTQLFVLTTERPSGHQCAKRDRNTCTEFRW